LKKFIFILSVILFLVGCNSQKANYTMISEMNNINPIDIIYFDDKTANEIGNFPINRKYYAEILDIIEESSPKIVILKFFFDSSTESDQILHNSISKYDNVFTQTTSFIIPEKPAELQQIKKLSLQDFEIPEISSSDSILLPNNIIIDDFAGIGFVDLVTNKKYYKNYPIVSKVGDFYIPSLALSIGRYISETDPIFDNNELILGDKSFNALNGYLRIDLSKPGALYKTHSFIDILNKTDRTDFKNKIVMIYIDHPSVNTISSEYNLVHNNAEIIADTINTMLKGLE
jgi:hypothetical protein